MTHTHRRAREIAQGLAADLDNAITDPTLLEPGVGPTEALVDRWESLVNSILEPNLVGGGRFKTEHGWQGHTDDPKHVEQFLDKYPEIRRALPLIQAQACECFPGETLEFKLELSTDPEGCAVCSEIQNLTLCVIPPESVGVKDAMDKLEQVDEWLVEDEQQWILQLPLIVML